MRIFVNELLLLDTQRSQWDWLEGRSVDMVHLP